MPADVLFHYLAAHEYRQARSWYFRRSPRTAHRFAEVVDFALREIAQQPGRWPLFDDRHRWVKLKKFPYLLVYRLLDYGDVIVVAVAHSRRRSGYWQRRR